MIIIVITITITITIIIIIITIITIPVLGYHATKSNPIQAAGMQPASTGRLRSSHQRLCTSSLRT
jgi:hypothetical protein